MSAKVEDGIAEAHRIVEASFVAALGIGQKGGSLPPATFTEVAFAGRSNVGKSSLINALVERRGLVRTSSTPGCTRQINVFEVKARDGLVLNLIDLPGYGFAKRSKEERKAWAQLIEGYLHTRPSLATLVVLFDARRGLEDDDRELVDFALTPRERTLRKLDVVLCATKVDKIPKSEERAGIERLKKTIKGRVVACSAVTGRGLGGLWRAIRSSALGTPSNSEARTIGKSPPVAPSEDCYEAGKPA